MVPYGDGIPQINPAPRLRTIVKPGAPGWVRLVAGPKTNNSGALLYLGGVVGLVALLIGLIGVVAWIGSAYPLLASILFIGLFGAGAAVGVPAERLYRRQVLSGPTWKYEGVAIKGKALSLLEDIDTRFQYAERMVDEVPTGIDWHEVAGDVRTLMWECAGHAARVSALDTEISEMRYASRGTPQAAFRKTLEERRSDHWTMLKDAQLEADALASVAGNAAAAAKVALLRTGSLAALEVVTPTAQGLAARHALRDARARLELLAEVWAQLDESNAVLAERVDADIERSEPRPEATAPRRRRRR